MIGIYCYFNSNPNVILPFYNVAVKLPEDNKDKVKEVLLQNYKDSSLSKLKSLGVKHFCYEIGKLEVEKYGVESAYYNSVKYLTNLDEEIVVSNCNKLNDFPKNISYISCIDSILELKAAYYFSKYYRDITLYKLSKYYPSFNINKHKGNLTLEHINILKQIKILPSFYNESFLVRYFLQIQQYPQWVQTYIKNHYEPIIK